MTVRWGMLSTAAIGRVVAGAIRGLTAAQFVAVAGRDPARAAEPNLRRALTHLAAAGRVGFDLATGSYFHRELPYRQAALQAQHPRLRDARALVGGGHVTLGPAGALVRSGTTTYIVRSTSDGERCTCAWAGTHGASRGPCKHALAVRLA